MEIVIIMSKYNTKALIEIVEILDKTETGRTLKGLMKELGIDENNEAEYEKQKQKLYTYLNRLINRKVIKAEKFKGTIKQYVVVSKDNLKRVSVLKDCVLEFNKLMDYNQDNIEFPDNLDKDKIRKGVKKCL